MAGPLCIDNGALFNLAILLSFYGFIIPTFLRFFFHTYNVLSIYAILSYFHSFSHWFTFPLILA